MPWFQSSNVFLPHWRATVVEWIGFSESRFKECRWYPHCHSFLVHTHNFTQLTRCALHIGTLMSWLGTGIQLWSMYSVLRQTIVCVLNWNHTLNLQECSYWNRVLSNLCTMWSVYTNMCLTRIEIFTTIISSCLLLLPPMHDIILYLRCVFVRSLKVLGFCFCCFSSGTPKQQKQNLKENLKEWNHLWILQNSARDFLWNFSKYLP